MTATCNNVLGPKSHTKNDWITQESLEKIQMCREIKAEVNNSWTKTERKAAKEKYSSANQEVRKSIKKDKNSYLQGLSEWAEMAAANGHMMIFHHTTRFLSGKQSKPAVPVKDLGGDILFEQGTQLKRWREHFTQLLNRPPPPDIHQQEETFQ